MTRPIVSFVLFSLAASIAAAADNLAVDASFESALPAWFAERAGTSYFAGKEQVAGAADGRKVLAIEGWDKSGSQILSGPFLLPDAKALTGTLSVRSPAGHSQSDVAVELALFDGEGKKQLASFGTATPDAAWHALTGTAERAGKAGDKVRLAIVVRGPCEQGRIEIDRVGLFAGPQAGPVSDNSDLAVIEAETLAGPGWKVVDHYGGWYNGTPSGMKMLAGSDRIEPKDNRPAVAKVLVRQPGRHRLWVRFHSNDYADQFTLSIHQQGAVRLERTIDAADKKYPRWAWSWESVETDLAPGEAEILLSRPNGGASSHARKIDMLVLTNRLDYQPEVEHFSPQCYLRFTNLSEGVEPFCLYGFVRRHQGPQWYANPGMLTRAGFSEGYYVPDDKAKWLAPGRSSPWVRMNDYLLAAGGRNNVQLIATRRMHTQGFIAERFRGTLELAVGDERRVVKTIAIDQAAPRLLLTLPLDFNNVDQIKTALDYIAETESHLARLGGPTESPFAPQKATLAHGPRAEHLNLIANISLRSGVDDPEALRREVAILRTLGFNQTYHLVAPPTEAVDFAARNNLVPRFGDDLPLWSHVEHQSQHHPDLKAMGEAARRFADENRPILDRMIRGKLMDEPGGMSYESICSSAPCRAKFAEWCRRQGLSPRDLGVADWSDVVPVLPAEREKKPELFYHTGLFRLEGFATLARACAKAKREALPATLRTYVNYSPPNSGGSWTERGTDLFLAQRSEGMEMVWTEDWLGYSAGPQHLSEILALCRAAGRDHGSQLGAYWVGQHSPELMRMKFYTLLAGGVRDIECYDYGPWYAGIDSWGREFPLYPAIQRCNREAATIDPYLHQTARRKTDTAILYNRTASIWALDDNSAVSDAGFLHWALAHAGYDAAYVAEEDVERGELAAFKVLYLSGRQIRRPAAAAIAAWVKQGGTLLGTAGAGTRDPYNRPLDVLDTVFAARSRDFQFRTSVGRAKYELRTLKPLNKLKPVGEQGKNLAEFDRFCFEERLEPLPGAEVVLADSNGRPAGTVNKYGKGTAIRLAALPGVSYIHEAVQPPYDIESYRPTAFRVALRDAIAWPARLAGAVRTAAAESPIAEIVRYDGPDRAVVFVIDHQGTPSPKFQFELFDAAGFRRAIAASGKSVELQPGTNGSAWISLPLDLCDGVVLLKD